MDAQIVVIAASYKPNTAPTNRLLSFIAGFNALGIETELVFVYPNANSDRIDIRDFTKIRVRYLWAKSPIRNRFYKYIRSFWDVHHYLRSLQDGKSIFLFGSSEYLSIIVRRKGLRVFQERTEHPSINPLFPSFMQRIYLRSCKSLTGMFVISTELKRVYEDLGVHNVHIVNMTVDSSRFVGLKKCTNEKYIAYCGTASNNKDGVDDLIKAFAIVSKTHPDVTLKVIGRAPDLNDESNNLSLVKQLGIKDKVLFTGVIPSAEMPQMLKNATVVALARPDSLQARCGFPTKLGEYLLSENPVVVTSVGDIPLFLKDGETALLSHERNPQEFASKIIWALEHPEESRAIGLRGRDVGLKYFNHIKEAEKIIQVIFAD